MKRHHATGHAILVALALFALWLLLRPLPWARWTADPALAAWVQAVGSIVAILIAIAVPAVQHQLSERRAHAEARARTQRQNALAVLLGEDFLHLCDALLGAVQRRQVMGRQTAFPDEAVADWRELSRSIDYAELQPEAVTLITEARRRLGLLESAYRDAGGAVAAVNSARGLDEASQSVREHLDRVRSAVGRDAS
jgi:hypothetical protein